MRDQALYTTAAQVIPVLVLVLFVEEALSNRSRSVEAIFDDLAFLALLVFGELTAITALIEGPGRFSEGVVVGALILGFMFLGIRIALRLTPEVSRRAVGIAYVVVFAVFGVLALVAGNDALPLAGMLFFAAATLAAMVARTRAERAQRLAERSSEGPDSG